MANTDPYNPADSAARATNSTPKSEIKPAKPIKPPVKGISHAAVPKGVNQPVNKIPANVSVGTSAGAFPPPGDPYWKANPITTEHKDGSLRKWGEDTTADKNPNALPVQMLPPTAGKPIGKPTKDRYEGYSTPGSGHLRYHED